MTTRSKSVINPDGRTVDTSHLQREIYDDLATYRKYKAEDGMKKRAIHTSKDYDEFRNFVSVSQLKPTSGRDISLLLSGTPGSIAGGSRNCAFREGKYSRLGVKTIGGLDEKIQRRKNEFDKCDKNLKSVLSGGGMSVSSNRAKGKHNDGTAKSSRAAHDFMQDWKGHCKNAEGTLQFLSRTPVTLQPCQEQFVLSPTTTCEQYFSTDIDSTILGDIVEALYFLLTLLDKSAGKDQSDNLTGDGCSMTPSDPRDDSGSSGIELLLSDKSKSVAFIQNWLGALSGCGRFDLSVSFLTSQQQLKLGEIVSFLKNSKEQCEGANEIGDLVLRYESLLK